MNDPAVKESALPTPDSPAALPDGKWTDRRTFWSETARTSAFALVGLIVTIGIVKRVEQHSEYEALVDSETLKIRQEVIDDFLRSSYAYSSVTYDALNRLDILLKYHEGDATRGGWDDVVEEWQGKVYDAYRIDRNRLMAYFDGELDAATEALMKQADRNRLQLKEAFDTKSLSRNRTEIDGRP